MRSLRRDIEIKDGVRVATLFTPHLFSFREETGLTLEVDENDTLGIMEAYADVFYLAALNAWVLDGRGDVSTFPHTRGDFHEYMAANPREFGKDMNFAVEALTGRKIGDLSAEAEKRDPGAGNGPEKGKKKLFRLIGRISRRS